MAHKMIKALVRDLDDQGFQVTRTRGNHFEARKAEGDFVTVLPSTASEKLGSPNALSYLRRTGYVDPKRPVKPLRHAS